MRQYSDSRAAVVLRDSAKKIRQLRNENSLISARLSGFDDALSLMRATAPEARNGYESDVAHEADQVAEDIEKSFTKMNQTKEK